MAGELDVIQNYLDRRAPPVSLLSPPAQPQPSPMPPPPVTFTPPKPPPQYGPAASLAPATPVSQAAWNSAIAHLQGERSENGRASPTYWPADRHDFAPPTTPTKPPRPSEGARPDYESGGDASFIRLPDPSIGVSMPATSLLAPAPDILRGAPAAAPAPGGLMPNRQGWLGMPWILRRPEDLPSFLRDDSRLGPMVPGMFDMGGPRMGAPGPAGPIPPFWMRGALPSLGEGATLLPRAFPIVPVP